jgi:hypothetical protein
MYRFQKNKVYKYTAFEVYSKLKKSPFFKELALKDVIDIQSKTHGKSETALIELCITPDKAKRYCKKLEWMFDTKTVFRNSIGYPLRPFGIYVGTSDGETSNWDDIEREYNKGRCIYLQFVQHCMALGTISDLNKIKCSYCQQKKDIVYYKNYNIDTAVCNDCGDTIIHFRNTTYHDKSKEEEALLILKDVMRCKYFSIRIDIFSAISELKITLKQFFSLTEKLNIIEIKQNDSYFISYKDYMILRRFLRAKKQKDNSTVKKIIKTQLTRYTAML